MIYCRNSTNKIFRALLWSGMVLQFSGVYFIGLFASAREWEPMRFEILLFFAVLVGESGGDYADMLFVGLISPIVIYIVMYKAIRFMMAKNIAFFAHNPFMWICVVTCCLSCVCYYLAGGWHRPPHTSLTKWILGGFLMYGIPATISLLFVRYIVLPKTAKLEEDSLLTTISEPHDTRTDDK